MQNFEMPNFSQSRPSQEKADFQSKSVSEGSSLHRLFWTTITSNGFILLFLNDIMTHI
jgi:hypothetical protein